MKKVLLAMVVLGLVGCRDQDGTDDAAANADSVATPPPMSTFDSLAVEPTTRGVQVTIKDDTLTLSHDEVAEGDVEFVFQNTEDEQHIIEITWEHGARWRMLPVGKGGRISMTATMNPGNYTVSCAVPGHKQVGEHDSVRSGAAIKSLPVTPIRSGSRP
jgi:hypothetical protein